MPGPLPGLESLMWGRALGGVKSPPMTPSPPGRTKLWNRTVKSDGRVSVYMAHRPRSPSYGAGDDNGRRWIPAAPFWVRAVPVPSDGLLVLLANLL